MCKYIHTPEKAQRSKDNASNPYVNITTYACINIYIYVYIYIIYIYMYTYV